MSLLFLTACAAPQPYYQSLVLSQPPVAEDSRAFLSSNLQAAMTSGRVTSVSLQQHGQTTPISSEEIEGLPLVALAASWGILDARSFQGAEWDAIVRLEGDGSWPVTAWWELDGTMRLAVGEQMERLGPAPVAAEALQARFGIGVLEDVDARWSGEERAALGEALGLLSEGEVALLSQMPFQRHHSGAGDHAAHFIHENGTVWIQLYDSLFSRDGTTFRGSVQAPVAPSAMGILHEVGHAIASVPRVRAYRRHTRAIDEYNLLVDELDVLRESRNVAALEALIVRLEAASGVVDTVGARMDALKNSPVLSAYIALRSHDGGPTPYGATSSAESFAESFALSRVDPAALHRIYPAVAEWFSSEEHLTIVEQSTRGL